MTEESSVQEHGVKMLSLVEKLEDLKVGLDNDTYIDVILQLLPPSYDPSIVNFNMNGLEKSINELINLLWEWARERGRLVLSSSRGQTISMPIAARKGIGRGIVPIYLPIKVLQRSRKLSKDEVVLRLGDGKAIAAEAMWHARLSHISEDRMKKLVDSKSLEIDNLGNLPACEYCLKGKINRNPFVGQSTLANSLLDLIHIDVCGPLNTQAREGFSYFITFTDDNSRYCYVYLMRYKSEAFVRFNLSLRSSTRCMLGLWLKEGDRPGKGDESAKSPKLMKSMRKKPDKKVYP
ncbi:UNVERIFIED_CONTAM: hypothetical protein Scaly_0475700 [Sesamum calycinum]|uniref:GAG-pre-integrase domain-containing protein n=1 Tax=Sesamum calycinum TaxID=2727403 RepID=A0AAW2SHT2_9LAMI